MPVNMIKEVKKSISIPLIVGGGIRNAKDAKITAKAGADIIVTGTIIENDFGKMRSIIEAVHKA